MTFTRLSAPDCRYAYAYAYAYANACSRSRTRSFLRNLPSTLTRHIYLHTTSHSLATTACPDLTYAFAST